MRENQDWLNRVERIAPLLVVGALAVIAYLIDDWKVLVLAPITWVGSRPD